MSTHATRPPFELTGAVYLLRPTGARAAHLEELRVEISRAPRDVLFFHTQFPRLQAADSAETPPDDFSAWVRGVLQDPETAERLAFAALTAPNRVEDLRAALLQVLDPLPIERRTRLDAPPGGEFVFLTTDIVHLPTGVVNTDAHGLLETLASANLSIWFHHVVEQPWLGNGGGPLAPWLAAQDLRGLAAFVEREAHSGRAMGQTRRQVLREWRRSRLRRRVVDAERSSEDARRSAGRDAVANLARRLTRKEPAR